MIAILTENYGHTYVAGIFENRKTAECALLKSILGYTSSNAVRWVDFTFGETDFNWDEGKIIVLEGDKIKFSQRKGW